MKRVLEIVPNVGVGPVRLGASREQVHSLLGPPSEEIRDRREMFFDGLFVDYDERGGVEFIEMSRSEVFSAEFDGVCLHDLAAESALAVVMRHAAVAAENPELGYSYIFPSLQLSLWRGTQPSVDQAVDDSEGRFFEAVGIGVPGYFSSTS